MNKNKKIDLLIYCLSICVLGIFIFFAWRNVDIQFLSYSSGDELPQFVQLNNMLRGYLNGDLEGMFRFEFYNYGYIYYLLNVLVTAPFNLFERYEWAIFAPRFLNGVFSILNLLIIYKISNLFLPRIKSAILVLFCLLIPGFWHYGFIFKPDVFQAFFVLASVYFLCLDSFVFKRNFYFAILMLGLGVGVAKFQAVMFLPLLCCYTLCPFLLKPSYKELLFSFKYSCISIFSTLLVWIITNPYLLHPKGTGIQVWWNMFVFNMQSNATNHGSYIDVSVWEKIVSVLGEYFVNPVLIVFGTALFVFSFSRILKQDKIRVFIPIFLAFLISLFYLLFLVNKGWGIYYVSTIYLGVLIIIPFCLIYSSRLIYSFIFVAQIIGIFYFQAQENFFKRQADLSLIEGKNQEIVRLLAPLVKQYEDPYIYTSWVNFSYLQLGLSFKNIHQIFGALLPYNINRDEFIKRYPYKSPQKYFRQPQIIVIEKPMKERNKQYASKDEFQKLSYITICNIEKYGYRLAIDSENFLIFVLK